MMFEGLTAWFSTSVDKKWTNIWILRGGKVSSDYNVLFLFSESNTASDTKILLESEDYQEYAILHPNYIKACIIQNTLIPIKIANYILFSKDMAKALKKKIMHQELTSERNIFKRMVNEEKHPIRSQKSSASVTNYEPNCRNIDWGLFLRSVGYVESSILGKVKNDLEFIDISNEKCPYSIIFRDLN